MGQKRGRMPAFRVSLNNQYVCTAGIEGAGVVTCNLTWVEQESSNSGEQKNDEELDLRVGGLRSDAAG
jgi:hypothetical protein